MSFCGEQKKNAQSINFNISKDFYLGITSPKEKSARLKYNI